VTQKQVAIPIEAPLLSGHKDIFTFKEISAKEASLKKTKNYQNNS